jgi:hypothetical protein
MLREKSNCNSTIRQSSNDRIPVGRPVSPNFLLGRGRRVARPLKLNFVCPVLRRLKGEAFDLDVATKMNPVQTSVTIQRAQESKPRTPPLKNVNHRAPQVHNFNSEWTYGSSMRMWSGDDLVECKKGGPPVPPARKSLLRLFLPFLQLFFFGLQAGLLLRPQIRIPLCLTDSDGSLKGRPCSVRRFLDRYIDPSSSFVRH